MGSLNAWGCHTPAAPLCKLAYIRYGMLNWRLQCKQPAVLGPDVTPADSSGAPPPPAEWLPLGLQLPAGHRQGRAAQLCGVQRRLGHELLLVRQAAGVLGLQLLGRKVRARGGAALPAARVALHVLHGPRVSLHRRHLLHGRVQGVQGPLLRPQPEHLQRPGPDGHGAQHAGTARCTLVLVFSPSSLSKTSCDEA